MRLCKVNLIGATGTTKRFCVAGGFIMAPPPSKTKRIPFKVQKTALSSRTSKSKKTTEPIPSQFARPSPSFNGSPAPSQEELTASSPKKARKEDQPTEEDLYLLFQFDLDLKYGPCIGITRRTRWLRAQRMNFNPPKSILELLDKFADNEMIQKDIWTGNV